MSSPKWEIVNGVRYPTGKLPPSEENEEFIYQGKEWVIIKEISFEEALRFARKSAFNPPVKEKAYCDEEEY
tara:strand:+ start:414 stop:626 length:213 start_codon:yes stop_codon:yes gene_type:complete